MNKVEFKEYWDKWLFSMLDELDELDGFLEEENVLMVKHTLATMEIYLEEFKEFFDNSKGVF